MEKGRRIVCDAWSEWRKWSDSSSDEGGRVSPSMFVKYGVLMKRHENDPCSWDTVVLDTDKKTNQWLALADNDRNRSSDRPFAGATVEFDLCVKTGFIIDDWCVVKEDNSVTTVRGRDGIVMLDVAVNAERMVRMDGRNVLRLFSKRVLDVYDYNNVLGKVEMGEVMRVLIKWSHIIGSEGGDKYRYEWVVHDYGKGEEELFVSKNRTRKEMKMRKELDQALKEFQLVEYASERDWEQNAILKRHLEVYTEKYMRPMSNEPVNDGRPRDDEREERERQETEESSVSLPFP
ncbi:hypothetical protein PENTCL1PPCAC_18225, partial [Pristionchus entomophagus]